MTLGLTSKAEATLSPAALNELVTDCVAEVTGLVAGMPPGDTARPGDVGFWPKRLDQLDERPQSLCHGHVELQPEKTSRTTANIAPVYRVRLFISHLRARGRWPPTRGNRLG